MNVKLAAGVVAVAVAMTALAIVASAGGGESTPPEPILPPAPIAYSYSGGLPMFADRLEIATDGRAGTCLYREDERIYSGEIDEPPPPVRHVGEADAGRLIVIRQALDAVPLAELAANVDEDVDIPHTLVHEIDYRGYEIRFLKGDAPPELREALRQLEAVSEEIYSTPKVSPNAC